jgi:UDP-glucose 4-epimerase
MTALRDRKEAVLSRPGVRDWIYAPDVADAVAVLVEAPALKHGLYNISTGYEWTALQWGRHLTALNPGFVCRLAEPGEAATIDLHTDADRAPLSISRIEQEFGWRARFGCVDSAAHLNDWRARYGEGM